MYCDFYQLRERPFNVTADPKFLYLNARYREALASLQYGISQRKGFVTLIGEAGTGKTTLLKKLLDDLDANTRTVFIFNTNVTFDEILEYIFSEFDLPVHNGKRLYMLQRLNAFLLDELQQGRNVALLIDEAQDLDQSVLEDLRLLSNLETAKEKILQIVLSGQPELGQKLGSPALRQLRQRVAINCRLFPLTRDEISEYIQSRITAAGGADPRLFTRDAEDRIFEISTGIPRLVNIVCDNALVIGYALGKRRIGAEVVSEAAADLLTMEVPEEPRDGRATTPGLVGAPLPRSRRWSQVGVVAIVLVAILVGLLSVGRSLLRREGTPAPQSLTARPPLEVIPPSTASGAAGALRDPRQPERVPPLASGIGDAGRLGPGEVADTTASLPKSVDPPTTETTRHPSQRAIVEREQAPADGLDAVPPNLRLKKDEPVAREAARPAAALPETGAAVGIPDPPAARKDPIVTSKENPIVQRERALPAAAGDVATVLDDQDGAVAAGDRSEPVPSPRGNRADPSAVPAGGQGLDLALERYEPVVVDPNQSISQIAARKYGQASHTMLDVMKMANPSIRDVDVVSVGQTLRLPELDEGLVLLRQHDGQLALLLLSSPNWSRVKGIETALRQHKFNAQVRETDFGAARKVYRLLIAGLPSRDAAIATGKKVQRLFREDEQIAALAR